MALLLMLVFCVGSVSAADDVNDTVAIDDNTGSVDTSIDEIDNSDLQSYQSEDNLSTRGTPANDWSTSDILGVTNNEILTENLDIVYVDPVNGNNYNEGAGSTPDNAFKVKYCIWSC